MVQPAIDPGRGDDRPAAVLVKNIPSQPSRQSTYMKTCERCSNTAVRGERYCKSCRKQVLAELREAGYFDPRPIDRAAKERKAEQRELKRESSDETDD